jgi:hypothetical protein
MPEDDRPPRSIADVDGAITVQRDSRKRQTARIEELLRTAADLRADCARATRRIDALLDEREMLTRSCPDTPQGIAEPVEDQA